jgi:hypothetical protein
VNRERATKNFTGFYLNVDCEKASKARKSGKVVKISRGEG